MAQTCPYCGGEVADDVQKCKHCGEWLEKKSSISALSYILFAVAMLFFIIGGLRLLPDLKDYFAYVILPDDRTTILQQNYYQLCFQKDLIAICGALILFALSHIMDKQK